MNPKLGHEYFMELYVNSHLDAKLFEQILNNRGFGASYNREDHIVNGN